MQTFSEEAECRGGEAGKRGSPTAGTKMGMANSSNQSQRYLEADEMGEYI